MANDKDLPNIGKNVADNILSRPVKTVKVKPEKANSLGVVKSASPPINLDSQRASLQSDIKTIGDRIPKVLKSSTVRIQSVKADPKTATGLLEKLGQSKLSSQQEAIRSVIKPQQARSSRNYVTQKVSGEDAIATMLSASAALPSKAIVTTGSMTNQILSRMYDFDRTSKLTYMTKSLALGYQSTAYAKQMTLLTETMIGILDTKLEAIKLNTASAEINKKSIADLLRESMIRTVTNKVTDKYMKDFVDTAESVLKRNIVNPIAGLGSKYMGSKAFGAKTLRGVKESAVNLKQRIAGSGDPNVKDPDSPVQELFNRIGSYLDNADHTQLEDKITNRVKRTQKQARVAYKGARRKVNKAIDPHREDINKFFNSAKDRIELEKTRLGVAYLDGKDAAKHYSDLAKTHVGLRYLDGKELYDKHSPEMYKKLGNARKSAKDKLDYAGTYAGVQYLDARDYIDPRLKDLKNKVVDQYKLAETHIGVRAIDAKQKFDTDHLPQIEQFKKLSPKEKMNYIHSVIDKKAVEALIAENPTLFQKALGEGYTQVHKGIEGYNKHIDPKVQQGLKSYKDLKEIKPDERLDYIKGVLNNTLDTARSSEDPSLLQRGIVGTQDKFNAAMTFKDRARVQLSLGRQGYNQADDKLQFIKDTISDEVKTALNEFIPKEQRDVMMGRFNALNPKTLSSTIANNIPKNIPTGIPNPFSGSSLADMNSINTAYGDAKRFDINGNPIDSEIRYRPKSTMDTGNIKLIPDSILEFIDKHKDKITGSSLEKELAKESDNTDIDPKLSTRDKAFKMLDRLRSSIQDKNVASSIRDKLFDLYKAASPTRTRTMSQDALDAEKAPVTGFAGFDTWAEKDLKRGEKILEILEAIYQVGGVGGGGPPPVKKDRRSIMQWFKDSAKFTGQKAIELPWNATKTVGKIGYAGAKALVKANMWGVGKIYGAAKGSAKWAFRKGTHDPFTDVYRKDKFYLGKPLVSKSKFLEGAVFEDGHKVKDVQDIDQQVFDARTYELLITNEDIKAGLVDPNMRPISKRSKGIRPISIISDAVGGAFRMGGKIGSAIFSPKNPMFAMYASIFKTVATSVTKLTGIIAKGMFGAGKVGLKALGAIAGPLLGVYRDLIGFGFKAGSKILGKVGGFFGKIFGSNKYINRKDLKEIVGDKLDDIYKLLDTRLKKRTAGDLDGDGDREGSYQDYMQKLKSQGGAANDAIASANDNRSAGKFGKLGILSGLAGLLGTRNRDNKNTDEKDDGGGGGGLIETALGTYLGSKIPGFKTVASKIGGAGSWVKNLITGAGTGAANLARSIVPSGAGKVLTGAASKLGVKAAAKVAGSFAVGAGAIAGAGYAVNDALKGDYVGAAIEMGSGLVSIIPFGIGAAMSLGIDSWKAIRDMKRQNPIRYKFTEKRMKAYGVDDEKMYGYTITLENMVAERVQGKRGTITSNELINIAGKYGIAIDNPNHLKMFDLWFRQRFMAVFYVYYNTLDKYEKSLADIESISEDDYKKIDSDASGKFDEVAKRFSKLKPDNNFIKSQVASAEETIKTKEPAKTPASQNKPYDPAAPAGGDSRVATAESKVKPQPEQLTKNADDTSSARPSLPPTVKPQSDAVTPPAKPETDPYAPTPTPAAANTNTPFQARRRRSSSSESSSPTQTTTPGAEAMSASMTMASTSVRPTTQNVAANVNRPQRPSSNSPTVTPAVLTTESSGKPSPSSTGGSGGKIGWLSAKYESDNSGGSAAIGYDATGKTSYGKYQIASGTGTFNEFIKFSRTNGGTQGKYVADILESAGSADTGSTRGAVPDAWRKLAKEGAVQELERAFIEKTHYQVAYKGLPKEIRALVDSSAGLQEVLWSTSVQQPYTASKLFQKAWEKSQGNPEEFIRQVYEIRKGNFEKLRSKDPKTHANVMRRLDREYKDAASAHSSSMSASNDNTSSSSSSPSSATTPTTSTTTATPKPSSDIKAPGAPVADTANVAARNKVQTAASPSTMRSPSTNTGSVAPMPSMQSASMSSVPSMPMSQSAPDRQSQPGSLVKQESLGSLNNQDVVSVLREISGLLKTQNDLTREMSSGVAGLKDAPNTSQGGNTTIINKGSSRPSGGGNAMSGPMADMGINLRQDQKGGGYAA